MICIDDCHNYLLDSFESAAMKQSVKFIKKIPVEGSLSQLETAQDGTTNEEVLRMLIHRLSALYEKLPSEETLQAKEGCISALNALERRTEDRKEREVEGTHKP